MGDGDTKRRNRLAMRLQIRYRTRNRRRTINLPSGLLQRSLYRVDGLAKESYATLRTPWVGEAVDLALRGADR